MITKVRYCSVDAVCITAAQWTLCVSLLLSRSCVYHCYSVDAVCITAAQWTLCVSLLLSGRCVYHCCSVDAVCITSAQWTLCVTPLLSWRHFFAALPRYRPALLPASTRAEQAQGLLVPGLLAVLPAARSGRFHSGT